jgi:hypothetical protein
LIGVPNPLLVGNAGFTLTVLGTGFVQGTAIVVGNTSLVTVFDSDTQLRAFVPASLLQAGGTVSVTVIKPQPTIGPSNALQIVLTSPAPGLLSVEPAFSEARLTETALPFQVTVTGFNFVANSVAQIDGTDVPTTFLNPTTVVASIPQPQMETARIALITVRNPDPIISTFHFDNAALLSIYNPVPTVTSIDVSLLTYDPTPRFQGDNPLYPAQVLIHGTNFAKDALSRYLTGSPCLDKSGAFTGVRYSSTLIIAKVNIACTGAYQFGFTNLQPGGGVSNLMSFNVSPYTPPGSPVTVSGLAPAARDSASGPFDLTIMGANFSDAPVVNFGTAVLFPTSVTANTIVVKVPAYLVSRPGMFPVSVTNPDLTGNSNAVLFTVN